jgi:hypothetical protein
MNRMRITGCTGLLLTLAVIGGCTASSKLAPVEPLEAPLSHYSSVIVSVESFVKEDLDREINDLEHLTVKEINKLNIFQDVSLGDGAEKSENTLLVKVSIMYVDKVSGSERFWLGVFAGQASIKADILFIDAQTGEKLGSYIVTGQSGGVDWSGGTSDAVRETAEGIASVISEYIAGK